jgi:hypothetical protein
LGVLALAGSAFARETPSRRDCSVYNGQPQLCNRLGDCTYDQRWGTCEETWDGGGHDGGSRGCSAYDFDPQLCNSQRDCTYDSRQRRCVDDWNNGGGREQCWYYDNDPRACSLAPGCAYDRNSRSCVDDTWNPNPNPYPNPNPGQAQTSVMHCASGQYRYSTCPVGGQIVNARIQQQTSGAQCVQGRTWGYQANYIWVDQGCRANFLVTYYGRW